MSYKYYSEDAVKEIMLKVKESQKNGSENGPSKSPILTVDEFVEFEKESSPEIIKNRKILSEYDHPSSRIYPDFEKTHILLERFLETEILKDDIWEKILGDLNENFTNESTVEVKTDPVRKKWVHLSHSNLETVATLTKNEKTATLKLSQRVGFWSSTMEGILHGAYISLLVFGFLFAAIHPSLAQSIGILLTIWTVAGLVVFSFSKSSRDKKRRKLHELANTILEGLHR